MFGASLRSRNNRRSRFEGKALCHLDALYGMAVRLTHDQREAEDLVQDTLLRAYENFDRFVEPEGGGGRCKAWLFRIMTNTFINKYRRRLVERGVTEALKHGPDTNLISQDVLHKSREPEAALQRTLVSEQVRNAIDALPDEFRLAVLLCDIEEFSYREIADILECPVGTVMSRLHRGRRMLRASLAGFVDRTEPAPDAADKANDGSGAAIIPLRRGSE